MAWTRLGPRELTTKCRLEKRWTKRSPRRRFRSRDSCASGRFGADRRAVGCRTQEALPVDRRLGSLCWNGVLPRPDRIVARPEALCVVELADRAGLVQLLGLLVAQRAHPLAADLEDAPRFLLCTDQIVAFADRVDHRLLAVRGLAGPESRNRDRLVPVVGRSHDHGVNVVARKHLVVVPCGEESRAVTLARGLQTAIEDITRRHEFHPRDAERGGDIGHSHPSGADDREADAVRRCDACGGDGIAG